jgi:hypothetical protein
VYDAQDPVGILFAGGCHVGGYPCGETLGFPQVAIEEAALPCPVETRFLVYATLRSTEAIELSCKDFRPTVLVLQLGHYETSREIGVHVKRILRPKPPGPDRSSSEFAFETRTDTRFSPVATGFLRTRLKLLVSALLSCAGHPIFDAKSFRSELGCLADCLGKLEIPHILVITPLPSVDPLVLRQRNRAGEIMRAVIESRGWQWVDCPQLMRGEQVPSKNGLPDRDLFADILHLGVGGHRALGLSLAVALRRALGLDAKDGRQPDSIIREERAADVPSELAS